MLIILALPLQARYFFQQLVSGVSYCHEMGICHRDLKVSATPKSHHRKSQHVFIRVNVCFFARTLTVVFRSYAAGKHTIRRQSCTKAEDLRLWVGFSKTRYELPPSLPACLPSFVRHPFDPVSPPASRK